ncbi:MAG: DUF4325 domain-containing protein [Rugosibacter sp.]|nr:MAG: DUF4325 domain-containing protein [Rugosibacter sp.]
MKSLIEINISKQFSREPAGRFPTDGPFCGEIFRKEFLIPALAQGERVVVILDGTEGYGSSFLDESFGGLVRNEGFNSEELHRRITIVSQEDESLSEEVWDYVDTAKPRAK